MVRKLKEWTTKEGYKAEAIFYNGHINGYVEVPTNHSAYGKDFNELEIDVHYGLTYGKGGTFGFDTAHSGDAYDMELWKSLIETEEERQEYEDAIRFKDIFCRGEIRKLNFVINEVESVSRQLKEIE